MGEFRTVTYEVHNPKIKQNQSVRFAVLADVHGSEFGTDNCDLQAKIRENLPDAILVAGDMVVRKMYPPWKTPGSFLFPWQRIFLFSMVWEITNPK